MYVDQGRRHGDDGALQRNMALAKSLGAAVETIRQKDVLGAVTDYALEKRVTDLFIGYSGPSRSSSLHRLPVYRLVRSLPGVDVHIIPDATVQLRPSQLDTRSVETLRARDIMSLVGIMTAATLLSVLIDRSRFSNSNIVTIYILAVLVTAATTAARIYGIIAAIIYILLFNFLFIEPRFSFLVYDPNYMVTYLVSLIAAVITGNISSKMKEVSLQSRMNAYQAHILLDASEALQRAQGTEEITDITVSRLSELLDRQIEFFPPEAGPEAGADREAFQWTLSHNQRTGFGTRHFSELTKQYLAVRTGTDIYGVIAVNMGQRKFNSFEENILLSLMSECALSLEGEKNRKEREAAQIVAENERFRSKLLRSISHDLRTPLTSISGNAANLLAHEEAFSDAEKNRIYGDIYEDSIWLIDLTENLLAITRLEENVDIHMTGEVVADVLAGAVTHAQRHKSTHTILLEADDECLVAYMDVPLIMQVLTNLIGNAVKHTPRDTTIRVSDRRQGDKVLISVSDDGPGIAEKDKPYIFDLFYTGDGNSGDSSRSVGLGLNLCRSIMDAHGESITLEDNTPHGSVFTITLQLCGKDIIDENI